MLEGFLDSDYVQGLDDLFAIDDTQEDEYDRNDQEDVYESADRIRRNDSEEPEGDEHDSNSFKHKTGIKK